MERVHKKRFDDFFARFEELSVENVAESSLFKHFDVHRSDSADREVRRDVVFLEILSDVVENDKSRAASDLESKTVFHNAGSLHDVGYVFSDLSVELVGADLLEIERSGTDSFRKSRLFHRNYEIGEFHRDLSRNEGLFRNCSGKKAGVVGIFRIGSRKSERSAVFVGISHNAVRVSVNIGHRNGQESKFYMNFAHLEFADSVAVAESNADPRKKVAGNEVVTHSSVNISVNTCNYSVFKRFIKPRIGVVENRVSVKDDVSFAVLAEFFNNRLKASVACSVVVRIADDIAVLKHFHYFVERSDLAFSAWNESRGLSRSEMGEKIRLVESRNEIFVLFAVEIHEKTSRKICSKNLKTANHSVFFYKNKKVLRKSKKKLNYFVFDFLEV